MKNWVTMFALLCLTTYGVVALLKGEDSSLSLLVVTGLAGLGGYAIKTSANT